MLNLSILVWQEESPPINWWWPERDFRSTTENVAGIAATAKALRLAMEGLELFVFKQSQMKLSVKLFLNIQIFLSFQVRKTLPPHILTPELRECVVRLLFTHLKTMIFSPQLLHVRLRLENLLERTIAMGIERIKPGQAVRLSLDLENDMSQSSS